ncbi:SusC/RagA family TonB-linked outer membrane protein [Sphingobacterium chuzhouense]|uniref:TonB-dependent receptor n=1 Tax=Sphingobacterium chuzhouense TaxID=1742264 RepID=A0ABR7XNW5_9SPHI|nr:TonB-dependent receptor [Sphingobacterium chuzhouense]MBD1420868.1 TonB-dependent receptor [Sphingobacterium chuzhouense]
MRKLFLFLSLLISYFNLSAQNTKQITGTVVDASQGTPLIGVSVSIKGSTLGAVTDVNGKYNIKVQAGGKPTLVFRYVAYEEQEVTVGDGNVVNVKLVPTNTALDEVVVIGYGEVQRRDLTGAIGSVNMEDLQKAPVGTALEALAGRVAGVQVQSDDGKPGAGINIVIRGANSLTQDNSPLYVIDGFPMEDANNNILNPAEIESMEVLKDASATAIYGARGANGVILITTKRGKEGAPTINYSAYGGFQNVIQRMDLMDPYEFVRMEAERDPVGVGRTYLRGDTTLDFYRNVAGYDWQDQLFNTAGMQDHSLSVSGGNKSTRYSFSGNIFDQKGVIINSGFGRKQGRVTLDQTFNDKFKVGVDARYTTTKTYGTSPGDPDSRNNSMNYLMYSVWGYRPVTYIEGQDLLDNLIDPDINTTNDYRINPILSAENELREVFNTRVILNGYAEYAFTKALKLKISGGINSSDLRNDLFNNSQTRYGHPQSLNKVNGRVLYTESDTWLNENLLTYNKRFNKTHQLTVVGGMTFQENNYKRYGFGAMYLPNESLGLAGLSQGEPMPITSINTAWSLMSYLARATYNYSGKYILTASYRADGSSKFAKNNRWGFFPSGSFAWRMIDEEFMKNQNVLTDAKLRIGYGVTGNNRVSEYATYARLNFDNVGPDNNGYYPFGNSLQQGLFISSLANPDLKWESTAQSNIGLDLGAFNQRINFTADYYKKKTTDLLLNAELPTSTGYASAFKNIGSTSNEGLELSLSSDIIRNKDFVWNSSVNIAFNRNKVLSLTQNQESLTSALDWDKDYTTIPLYIAKIGQPLGQFYGMIWDGVYQPEDFDSLGVLKGTIPTNGNPRENIRPGDIRYRDLNEDGVVDDNDRTVIGRGYPLHQGGFSNTFNYKGFDLNIFLQWSYGNDILNANRLMFEYGVKARTNQFETFADRWTPDNRDTEMFRLGGQGPVANSYSTRVVEDGSYLRLKTVSLGYTINPVMLNKYKIRSLRIYASAQNLFTMTNYSGYDPEVSVMYSGLTPGFDYSSYPRPKTIVFGLNLSL